MSFLARTLDVFLHLNQYITVWAGALGGWFYGLVFLVVFAETGFVVTPFLPGDSLLFACGAIAALEHSPVDIWVLIPVLFAAAVAGDTANYFIGQKLGVKVFTSDTGPWLNKKHLERAHKFYEKYGGKTIIIARFIPIIRTFAPFVAGIGTMHYGKFISYNIIGGALWVLLFTLAGYFFADMPFVQKQFHYVILSIIIISLLPAVYEFVMEKYFRKS